MTRLPDLTSQASLITHKNRVRDREARDRRLELPLIQVAIGFAAILFSAKLVPWPRLVWNTTASAPQGLYFISPAQQIRPGDMVVARVPRRFRRLVDQRRYIPSDLSRVKHVAAMEGDRGCARGRTIRINDRQAASHRTHDSLGRSMPKWTGCVRLGSGELFLFSDHSASFDGRYVGVTRAHEVIGTPRFVWAR